MTVEPNSVTAVGLTLLVSALPFAVSAIGYVQYRRVLRRNCGPIGAAIAVCLVQPSLILLALFSPPSFAMWLLPTTVVVTPVALWCWPVSSRRRKSGLRRSRIPFLTLGVTAIVGAIVLVAFALFGSDAGYAARLAFATIALGFVLVWLHERLNAANLDQRLRDDERPPVLYLRTFRSDEDFFIFDAPEHLQHLISNPLVRDRQYNFYNRPLRFEEFFSEEINRRWGPFVALGSPEDYLPSIGAARSYERDDDWQTRLGELARSASLIVMNPGESSNLAWELNFLRENGLHHKLLIWTPPDGAGPKWWISKLYARYLRWARRIPNSSWQSFVATMSASGYPMPPEAPPPGSTVVIADNGSGLVITSGAKDPAEYLDAFQRWALEVEAAGS